VHSGSVTDTLTLISPQKTHFTIASDGHGASKVMLDPPATAGARGASIASHALVAEQSLADLAVSSNHDPIHMSDFLFAA
jgi:hypothetical protein